jgi:hypothetical protein
MIGLAGCVLNGREYVFSFQEGIIPEDFIDGGARGKQFKHVRHAHAIAADARATAALSVFDRDSVEALDIH